MNATASRGDAGGCSYPETEPPGFEEAGLLDCQMLDWSGLALAILLLVPRVGKVPQLLH